MFGLSNLKITSKIALIVISLAIQMAGQIWFASSRMRDIDDAYSDVVRRVDKYTTLSVRAARHAEAYISGAFQLAGETTDEGSAVYLSQTADSRKSYEILMSQVLKNMPEKATVIEPVISSFQKAFAVCDPAVQFAAKAVSPEDNFKATGRLKTECVPLVAVAIKVQAKLTDSLLADTAKASDDLSTRTNTAVNTTFTTVVIGLLLNFIFAMWIGIAGLARPIVRLKTVMEAFARNDLNADVPGNERRDEIGDMARTVEVFKKNGLEVARLKEEQLALEKRAAEQRKADMLKLADDFEGNVVEIIQTVTSASTELEAAANTLTSTADREQHLANTVAAASEQASTNVQSVASATEQMASSVNEIARQVQQSASIAYEAVDQARKTNNRISELAKAASRIGDVVDLINNIAGQTNLLALNATIEAARAGEAGRGFAVVAQEVKALAEQTGKATGEISQQIAGMQAATRDSVTAIKEIGDTIERMSEISSTIASAVEEQGAATQEIARNVQQAAQGTSQVSASICDVQQGASETGAASSQVLSAAQSLSRDSNRLTIEVGKFMNTVRAA
jgi:methyl-accepting chemotaxis protein